MNHDTTPAGSLPDTPLLIEQLLLEADELSAAGAPHDQVDDLILAAVQLLTDQQPVVR